MSNVIKIPIETRTVGAVRTVERALDLAIRALADLEHVAGQAEVDELVTASYRARWEHETIRRMLGWPNH